MNVENFLIRDIQSPFRLDLTAWALQRKKVNKIDVWNGETYSRILEIDQLAVLIEVNQLGGSCSPRLYIRATSEKKISNLRTKVRSLLKIMLGFNIDLASFYKLAREDKKLFILSNRFMGLKPPRFPSVFEALVNGIACQQLSLHVGLTLLNRLGLKCGLALADSGRCSFPTIAGVSKVSDGSLRRLGFSGHKVLAIKNLVGVIEEGSFRQESINNLSDEQALLHLTELKGVGRWTAEYVLLRGLGRIHIFPGDDVGARAKLKKWLRLRRDLDYEQINKILAKWKPYCGLIYFHLLLKGLQEEGEMD